MIRDMLYVKDCLYVCTISLMAVAKFFTQLLIGSAGFTRVFNQGSLGHASRKQRCVRWEMRVQQRWAAF